MSPYSTNSRSTHPFPQLRMSARSKVLPVARAKCSCHFRVGSPEIRVLIRFRTSSKSFQYVPV